MADDSLAEARVGESVTVVVDRLGDRRLMVIESIQRRLATEILELRGDAELLEILRASVAGNVETVLDAIRYDIAIERVEPPTAALEYARRLAQRSIPVSALVRAYRLGQQEMLDHVLDEIHRAKLEPQVALAAFEAITRTTFGYIDWISQQVTDAYETERERWLENRNSVRGVRVRELLGGATDQDEHGDIDAASAAIQYPLRRNHLAVVMWTGANESPGGELLRLERFLREAADALELRDSPLFVAADRVSGWGWLPLITTTTDPIDHLRRLCEDVDNPPFVAVGTVEAGLAGFRQSHRQARDACRVALAGTQNRRLVAAGDPGVATAALLTEDVPQTRDWVCKTLGPLASDTTNDARLRETLRVFLREGSSYKAAAEQLNLHHNSVKYRIQRAVERRGRPITDDRIDVELALLVCHQFGTTVLRAGPDGHQLLGQ